MVIKVFVGQLARVHCRKVNEQFWPLLTAVHLVYIV